MNFLIPKIINSKEKFIHWKIDTMIGTKDKHEPVLLTLTERKTQYELVIRITEKKDFHVR